MHHTREKMSNLLSKAANWHNPGISCCNTSMTSSNLLISHSSGASWLIHFSSWHVQMLNASPVTVSRQPFSHLSCSGVPLGGGEPNPPQMQECWLTQKAQIQYSLSPVPQVRNREARSSVAPPLASSRAMPSYSSSPKASAQTAATKCKNWPAHVCVTMTCGILLLQLLPMVQPLVHLSASIWSSLQSLPLQLSARSSWTVLPSMLPIGDSRAARSVAYANPCWPTCVIGMMA
mmetsp:Transcript_11277/g.28273  ORF Transcript_11277/g.28273 Transcript_11277/m.28273 type:complete len:233 (-) Transcript_11277:1089-1787(-)